MGSTHDSAFSKRNVKQRGFLMLAVCVLLLLMISAAYVFSERMLITNIAASGSVENRQSMALSDSGVAYVSAKVRSAFSSSSGTASRANWQGRWQGEVSSSSNRVAGQFAIKHWDSIRQSWMPGVMDESIKLNLNTLPLEKVYAPEARRMLMCLPGVDISLADSILDWMDQDEDRREFGAESTYYRSLPDKRNARNQRLDHLRDLLGVRGITRELLFGPDGVSPWNVRPSVIQEDSFTGGTSSARGSNLLPLENFLTVFGGESIYQPDGKRKVLLNQDDLVQLFDEISPLLGEDAATYIVAYRLFGPKDKSVMVKDEFSVDQAEQTRLRALNQGGDASDQPAKGSNATLKRIEKRGPLLIKSTGDFLIRSPYDLVGVAVEYQTDQGTTMLPSPWPESDQTFLEALPALDAVLSCALGTSILAKVNVNRSPTVVLRSIPGMKQEVLERILLNRGKLRLQSSSRSSVSSSDNRQGIDWLRSSGALDLVEMRTYAPYLTDRGTAFRFISSGTSFPSGITSHQEVVLDFRHVPSRVAYMRVFNVRELLND